MDKVANSIDRVEFYEIRAIDAAIGCRVRRKYNMVSKEKSTPFMKKRLMELSAWSPIGLTRWFEKFLAIPS